MSLIDMAALRALVADEVRSQLAGRSPVPNHEPPESAGALWAAQDVADFLKASRSWVYEQAEAGHLPCFKIGGLLRFDPAAVRAFVRGQKEEGAKVLSFKTKVPRKEV